MYPNGYFHPLGSSNSFPQIPQIMLQNDGISANDERLRLINDQVLLNEARNVESYILEQTSNQQVKQLCSAVEKQGGLEDCLKFLNKLESTNRHSQTDPIAKLKCKVLYEQSQFEALYQLIQNHPFGKEYHKDLQQLWNDAHYKETELVRGGKGLDPVSRYRVRRKHDFPMTIWDGEKTSYCFKKRDRKILKEAYDQNSMPSQAEKQTLAQKTELSVVQVSNWFKNQRQRARQNKKDQHGRPHNGYAHSVSDGYFESDREDSGASGGSRGSDDDIKLPPQHGLKDEETLSLLNQQQQFITNSFSSMNIPTTPASLIPSHQTTTILNVNNLQQMNSNAPTSSTNTASMSTNIYNNFNFAPHFENYWPTSTSHMSTANPFAAQMYYPFGVYSYGPSYPPMYQQSAVAQQYIKIMDSDSLGLAEQPNSTIDPTRNSLSQQPNLTPNAIMLTQQQQENYQQQFGQVVEGTKYKTGKYEPDQDYQNL